MKAIWLWSISAIGVGTLVWVVPRLLSSAPSPLSIAKVTPITKAIPTATVPAPTIEYKSYTLADSTVYTLKIPMESPFVVLPAVVETVELPAAIAQRQNAIAALNGGFFDPDNQQSTAYVVVNGKLVADPRQNERLMQNPKLTPYLSKILNRTEFRQYQCGDRHRYDFALRNDAVPAGCQLIHALGGGPRLLPTLTAQQEGFTAEANGIVIRDALGSSQPNARTAIGITRDRSLLWVMVAQKPGVASGMTLQVLATFMQTLDVEQAMNLDGGSSSSLYYNAKTVYGKRDQAGQPVMRSVKSVLLLKRAVDRK
ncbi:MAG: phosphodiester glycosidase family protein [Tildeniella nuda ZEHNDER 1965/U140]|nr:phosphodiester glycosidase family protein [Tildeniella nuda ZEHNDER 1965/U140]